MMTKAVLILLTSLSFSIPAAQANQALAGPVGTFTSACAGYTDFSTLPDAGYPIATASDQYITCSTTNGATVSNSGVYNGIDWSNVAYAYASPGHIAISGANQGANAVPFPGSASTAGWNDTYTIGSGGGSAIWVYPVWLSGAMSASGARSAARMQLGVYRNYQRLQASGNSANQTAYNIFLANNVIRNGDILFSWDSQKVAFGVADDGPGDPLTSLNVARFVTFAIPITLGTSFEMGVYMNQVVGESSAGSEGGPNSAESDFSHTAVWGGPGYLLMPDDSINRDFTITAQSGFDYNQSFVPEPSAAVLLPPVLAGIALLLYRRRLNRGM